MVFAFLYCLLRNFYASICTMRMSPKWISLCKSCRIPPNNVLRSVVRKVNSAIHQIVIFLDFPNTFDSVTGRTYIDNFSNFELKSLLISCKFNIPCVTVFNAVGSRKNHYPMDSGNNKYLPMIVLWLKCVVNRSVLNLMVCLILNAMFVVILAFRDRGFTWLILLYINNLHARFFASLIKQAKYFVRTYEIIYR